MRKILTSICFIFISSLCYSQDSEIRRYIYKKDTVDIPFTDGKILFSKIIDMEGVDVDNLYSCVKSVIPSFMHKDERKSKVSVSGIGGFSGISGGIGGFSGGIAGFGSETTVRVKDMNSSVLIENEEYNTITIRSWIDCYFNRRTKPFEVWFTMRIECQDGRYRMLIYDLVAEDPPRSGSWGEVITQNAILIRGIKKNNELIGHWGVSMVAFYVTAHDVLNEMQAKMETIIRSTW